MHMNAVTLRRRAHSQVCVLRPRQHCPHCCSRLCVKIRMSDFHVNAEMHGKNEHGRRKVASAALMLTLPSPLPLSVHNKMWDFETSHTETCGSARMFMVEFVECATVSIVHSTANLQTWRALGDSEGYSPRDCNSSE